MYKWGKIACRSAGHDLDSGCYLETLLLVVWKPDVKMDYCRLENWITTESKSSMSLGLLSNHKKLLIGFQLNQCVHSFFLSMSFKWLNFTDYLLLLFLLISVDKVCNKHVSDIFQWYIPLNIPGINLSFWWPHSCIFLFQYVIQSFLFYAVLLYNLFQSVHHFV